MRRALAVMCAFTLVAIAYLSLSLFVLRPPRANGQMWVLMGSLFAAQGVLTLAALRLNARALRSLALVSAYAVIWMGASWVRNTLASDHFEGYALVLGSGLLVQAALTILTFARGRALNTA